MATTIETPKAELKPDLSPPLRWVGGKREVLNQYLDHLPSQFEAYHEPFLGGGAVFLHLASKDLLPKKVFLSDAEADLVNAWSFIKNDVEGLIHALTEYHGKYQHTTECYQLYRSVFNAPTKMDVERAALFLLLMKTNFNGLFRRNQNNSYNVPIGKISASSLKLENFVAAHNLRSVSEVLKGVKILTQDFRESLKAVRKNDLVYLDPPYQPLVNKNSFTKYNQSDFGLEEQSVLAGAAIALAHSGAKVMVSNSDTPITRDLYSSSVFDVVEISARRSVNSKGDRRGPVPELLFVSKNCHVNLH